MEARLDLEMFLIGEMKTEFLNYLSEVFKDDFVESLSWGHFRRFQLTISEKNKWININFIMLKNEENLDLLINTFKIFEKKNLVLNLYNANDQKSDKKVETLTEEFNQQKEKVYDGILKDDNIKKSTEKIKTSYKLNCLEKIKNNNSNVVIKNNNNNGSNEFNAEVLNYNTTRIKDSLAYLENDSSNILVKVGFYPNTMNRKTKLIKKNDTNNAYSKEDMIFELEDIEKDYYLDFSGLFTTLLSMYFSNFDIKNTKVNSFIKLIKRVNNNNNEDDTDSNSSKNEIDSEENSGIISGSNNSKKKSKRYFYSGVIDVIVKIVDWLIVVYISYSLYKFLNEYNS